MNTNAPLVYGGERHAGEPTWGWPPRGQQRPLDHHVHHPLGGLEWGYGGSRPADLARLILADRIGWPPPLAVYQQIKWEVVAGLLRDGFKLAATQVDAWIARLYRWRASWPTGPAACRASCLSWLAASRSTSRATATAHATSGWPRNWPRSPTGWARSPPEVAGRPWSCLICARVRSLPATAAGWSREVAAAPTCNLPVVPRPVNPIHQSTVRGAEPMTVTHEQLLADIERRVAGDGAGPDQVDARIAAELGVPPDYYFAYLLVWGAIERHRELILCKHTAAVEPDELDEAGGTPLQRALSLADTIGWAAATIYGQTAGDGHRQVNTVAAQLVAAALQLRANLRQLDAGRDADLAWEASAPARNTSGREVGIDGR